MFNLNKSLAKLKSFIEENNLQRNQLTSNTTKTNGTKSKKKTKKTNSDAINSANDQRRCIIMIRNFPHGFYEQQMYDYFSQFGEVTRLKILRSRKTGKPKNCGFIEFRFEDVAEIAAETMNNYLMFEHIVKCQLIPPEKITKNIFRNWNRPFISSIEKHRQQHNNLKSNRQELRMVQRHLHKLRKMNQILNENDISFNCIVVNRPTDLKNGSKNLENDNAIPTEIIHMKRPKTRLATLLKRKRMINAKFMKMKAGFRV